MSPRRPTPQNIHKYPSSPPWREIVAVSSRHFCEDESPRHRYRLHHLNSRILLLASAPRPLHRPTFRQFWGRRIVESYHRPCLAKHQHPKKVGQQMILHHCHRLTYATMQHQTSGQLRYRMLQRHPMNRYSHQLHHSFCVIFHAAIITSPGIQLLPVPRKLAILPLRHQGAQGTKVHQNRLHHSLEVRWEAGRWTTHQCRQLLKPMHCYCQFHLRCQGCLSQKDSAATLLHNQSSSYFAPWRALGRPMRQTFPPL